MVSKGAPMLKTNNTVEEEKAVYKNKTTKIFIKSYVVEEKIKILASGLIGRKFKREVIKTSNFLFNF